MRTKLPFILLILHPLILHFMGQPLIFKGGYIKPWHGVVISSENSQHITDWYTFSHIIHGMLFFWLLNYLFKSLSLVNRYSLALCLETFWEILENSHFIIDRYRSATIALDYYGDSIINSFSDLIAMSLGFFIANRYSWKFVLGILIFFELFVVYAIRDNLTLNIIMLTYPIEAIKAWQQGIN
jgi:hypothetical protein